MIKHIIVMGIIVGGIVWNEIRLRRIRFEIETEDALREAYEIINSKNINHDC